MCGIAGIVGKVPSESVILEMLSTMQRRGPDDCGAFTDQNVCLMHRRLSIIDPLGGHQPMTIEFEGETYTIVYNGELYNAEEIRYELQKLGHPFLNKCDTEVVLRAYITWKEQTLLKLNGIFSFAVWEQKNKRLFIARDRIGVKPFFYTHKNGVFMFASELKTILAHPEIEARIDAEGIAQILCLGPGRKPGSGVFHNFFELKPGYYGFYESGKLLLHRYWKLSDRDHTDSFEETIENVRYLVTDAIKRQMVSDVPFGTFLSGGLDSSLISAVCADQLKKRGEQLHTFSVDYNNNEKYFVPGKFQPNADGEYIEIMRRNINSLHHKTVLSAQDLVNALEEATRARDLPGMADVDFSLMAFCKEIRNDVKMALSGECADEIFGGYPWYRDPEIRAREGFPWAQNTAQRASLLHPRLSFNAEDYVQSLYSDTIKDAEILPGTSALERRMKEMVVLNQTWFMQTLLDRKDRMSMWCGLEVRVPFCDYRIAEYLYGVPWELKDYRTREKGLLRCAVQDLLPDEILWRKKSPYPKTYDPEYLRLIRERFDRMLLDKDAPIRQIVNVENVKLLAENEGPWPWYGQLMKLPQTLAYMVQINEWLKMYHVEVM